ncbi:hypothetical protein ACE1CI_15055 [Aerosakkonemataceae cyanobacterium BLCC-F50]|uniref:GIY-YIG domain-containing protein n=1 Tax=Floridaenema flaviceps BLCC-F50 TaxID=3153642 RepID=A0ABV4XT20_9CYAN
MVTAMPEVALSKVDNEQLEIEELSSEALEEELKNDLEFKKIYSATSPRPSHPTTKKTPSALSPGRMRESSCVKGKECQIPNEPGIYRFINRETRAIDYIGQTSYLRRRLQ